MDITKEQARKLIENKILIDKRLPIYDEIIYSVLNNNQVTEYSFRGLLKYIYDLD